jgi:hypothetical protein
LGTSDSCSGQVTFTTATIPGTPGGSSYPGTPTTTITVVRFTPNNDPPIPDGATVELGASDMDDVTFMGPSGKLVLDQSQSYTGHIFGFGGEDEIDLRDIAFGPQTSIGFLENASDTAGVLTVGDGVHTTHLFLAGSYAAASFGISNDGRGGTLVAELAGAVSGPGTAPSPGAGGANLALLANYAAAGVSDAGAGGSGALGGGTVGAGVLEAGNAIASSADLGSLSSSLRR